MDDVFEAAGSAYQVFNSCWSSSQLGLHNAFFWQRVWLPCTHFLYHSLHTAHAVMNTLLGCLHNTTCVLVQEVCNIEQKLKPTGRMPFNASTNQDNLDGI